MRSLLRQIIFSLSVFCITSLAAQIQGSSGHLIYCAEAGITNFRPYGLNHFLFSTGPMYDNMITYGISVVEPAGGRAHFTSDATTGFHLFLPQKYFSAYDSCHYMLRGWELMTSIYGYDVLHKVGAVDLVIAPGVYWGCLKVRKYFNGGNAKQFELFKNPFVAPMIRADLRFVVGPVSLGARVSWRYDITNTGWRKGSSVALPGYRFEELQYMISLGWKISNEN